MIDLTPQLAHILLNIWERRQLDPPATIYSHTVLEVALGAPEEKTLPPRPKRTPAEAAKRVAARRRDTDWLT